jgi:hypothetical protein
MTAIFENVVRVVVVLIFTRYTRAVSGYKRPRSMREGASKDYFGIFGCLR